MLTRGCLFHPRVTAVAHKRHWSFCQKCRWQVAAKYVYSTKLEWVNYIVQAHCGEPTHNSSEDASPQTNELTEPLWTDPGPERKLSRPAYLHFKEKKSAGGE